MELKGWKGWELALLKGAIVLCVFPMMVLAGATLASFVLGLFASLLSPTESLARVGVLACYGFGVVFAFLGCRKVWPRRSRLPST